ncbi:HKR1 [Symbiodinium sp. CCMP2592]|nr:HKR1 [Symbiodinium sp. CCMP2592]
MACAAPPSSPTGRAAEVETEIEDNGAADDEDEAETGLPADEVDEELVEVDTVETIERSANMQHPSADRATPSESSTARTADYSVPEQSKEVWKHFGCDTEAGRMLRKLYKGAGSRELGSKISYPQLATPATRWQPPPKAKPAAPKAVVRVPRAAAPRRDMDDPRQWPAPPIPCRRPAREIFAELEAEEARRRRAQPDLPKGKDLDHEKQNLQDRFRYCGGRMLPKGSMGYVEPGSVPPTGGAAEAATRREDRRRYDENGFDGEQREIFEDLVRAVQRKQARLAVIDDEQLADPKPSKAKTARNKEALELRNGIERDLKDIETLMSLAEGQAHKATAASLKSLDTQRAGKELLWKFPVPVPAPAAGYAPTAPAAPTTVYGDPVKERVEQLRARLQQSGYSLAQGFAFFDQTGGGALDRAGFMKLLDWVQVAMTAAEQELLFQRCSAGPGLLNYREVANQFDTSKQDANAKVSQLAAWWREHNANLADLFRFFDANGDNMLDKVEFTYLLQTADPYMPEHMAHTIFDLSASRGGVGYADFTRSFGITPESLPAPAPTPAPSPWLTAPEANSLTSVAIQSPAVRALASRIRAWLEPTLLSKSLGLEGLGGGSRRGKLTKPHFEHLCLAVEPGLEARELLRLFGQARATQAIPGQSLPEEIDAADFVQRFGPDSPEPPRSPGQDMWALSALRRIAKAASAALTGPEQVFQKFDMDGNGCLSSLEFERFLRTQEPNLSEQDVTWLWRLADSDQDGQVVLHEFVWALRQLQIEADRAQPSTEPSTSKDQVIEVKVAQLARLLHKRGYSLEKALSVYDRKRSGFLTRDSFKELLRAAQFKLSDTEVDEVMLQCDTACDGLLDSRELLRRLSAAADRPKYQSSAPQPPGPPRNPQPPGHGPAPPAPAAAVLPPPAVPSRPLPPTPGAPSAPSAPRPGAPIPPATPLPPGGARPPMPPSPSLPRAPVTSPAVPSAPAPPTLTAPPAPSPPMPGAPRAPIPPAAPGPCPPGPTPPSACPLPPSGPRIPTPAVGSHWSSRPGTAPAVPAAPSPPTPSRPSTSLAPAPPSLLGSRPSPPGVSGPSGPPPPSPSSSLLSRPSAPLPMGCRNVSVSAAPPPPGPPAPPSQSTVTSGPRSIRFR